MGFDNPSVPWSEIERLLSDRRRPGRSARGCRRRRQPGVVAQARALCRRRRSSVPPRSIPYAELHAHSSFSFLDGASSPEELAEEAERLGLHALAITDHDGFYGIVRFAEAAESLQLKTVFGAELSLELPDAAERRARPGRRAPARARPAARRAITGSPAPSRTRSCRGRRRGGPSTTSTSSPRRRTGTSRS